MVTTGSTTNLTLGGTSHPLRPQSTLFEGQKLIIAACMGLILKPIGTEHLLALRKIIGSVMHRLSHHGFSAIV